MAATGSPEASTPLVPGRSGPVRGAPPPLRLTRRGRTVLVVGLIMLLAAVVAVLAPASRAADPRDGAPPTAVVRPGDTLWSIAERRLPGHDPYLAIAEIRRLNGLDGYTIYSGQELLLPANR